jgi:transposase
MGTKGADKMAYLKCCSECEKQEVRVLINSTQSLCSEHTIEKLRQRITELDQQNSHQHDIILSMGLQIQSLSEKIVELEAQLLAIRTENKPTGE